MEQVAAMLLLRKGVSFSPKLMCQCAWLRELRREQGACFGMKGIPHRNDERERKTGVDFIK